MKILITGRAGSGKSIFSKYLKDQLLDFTIIDFDDFHPDIKAFESNIKKALNCIVVIQEQKFIDSQIEFDDFYFCSRSSDRFQVHHGLDILEFEFLNMRQYFDPRLDGAFS